MNLVTHVKLDDGETSEISNSDKENDQDLGHVNLKKIVYPISFDNKNISHKPSIPYSPSSFKKYKKEKNDSFYKKKIEKNNIQKKDQPSSRPALKNITNVISHEKISVTVQKRKQQHQSSPSSANISLEKFSVKKTTSNELFHSSFLIDPKFDEGRTSKKNKIWSDIISVSSDYHPDIYEFMLKTQQRYQIIYPNGMTKEGSEITPRMRTILMEWMAEVVEDYGLSQETLHLAANYVDRYFNVKAISRVYFQLLGMAALLVASKFEELHPCKIKELLDVCNGCYTADQIHLMERKLITALDFGLHVSTAHSFAFFELSRVHPDEEITHLTNFILELCLANHRLLQFPYQEVANAVIYLVLELSYNLISLEQNAVINFDIVNIIKSMISSSFYQEIKGIITKYSQLHQLIEDQSTADALTRFETEQLVFWSTDGKSFFITNPLKFVKFILPKYFPAPSNISLNAFIQKMDEIGFQKLKISESNKLLYGKKAWQYSHKDFHRNVYHDFKSSSKYSGEECVLVNDLKREFDENNASISSFKSSDAINKKFNESLPLAVQNEMNFKSSNYLSFLDSSLLDCISLSPQKNVSNENQSSKKEADEKKNKYNDSDSTDSNAQQQPDPFPLPTLSTSTYPTDSLVSDLEAFEKKNNDKFFEGFTAFFKEYHKHLRQIHLDPTTDQIDLMTTYQNQMAHIMNALTNEMTNLSEQFQELKKFACSYDIILKNLNTVLENDDIDNDNVEEDSLNLRSLVQKKRSRIHVGKKSVLRSFSNPNNFFYLNEGQGKGHTIDTVEKSTTATVIARSGDVTELEFEKKKNSYLYSGKANSLTKSRILIPSYSHLLFNLDEVFPSFKFLNNFEKRRKRSPSSLEYHENDNENPEIYEKCKKKLFSDFFNMNFDICKSVCRCAHISYPFIPNASPDNVDFIANCNSHSYSRLIADIQDNDMDNDPNIWFASF